MYILIAVVTFIAAAFFSSFFEELFKPLHKRIIRHLFGGEADAKPPVESVTPSRKDSPVHEEPRKKSPVREESRKKSPVRKDSPVHEKSPVHSVRKDSPVHEEPRKEPRKDSPAHFVGEKSPVREEMVREIEDEMGHFSTGEWGIPEDLDMTPEELERLREQIHALAKADMPPDTDYGSMTAEELEISLADVDAQIESLETQIEYLETLQEEPGDGGLSAADGET